MLLAALFACSTVHETNYPNRYANAYCSYLEECKKAAFNDEFSDRDDCVDEVLEDVDEDELEACDFDVDKAKGCLESMKEAKDECDPDELEDDDCTEVLTNCSVGGLGRVTVDNFAEFYITAYCGAGCSADLSAICDRPLDTTDGGTAAACDFQANAAAACVDPANWTCEPLGYGSDDTYPSPPAACLEVCG